MKRIIKRIFIGLLFITLLLSCTPLIKADNGSSSINYTIDASNNWIPTQDAYINYKIINSFNNNTITLNQPEDIYYDEINKFFYIADTGNKRIIKVDNSFKNATIIGEGILDTPQGIFTSPKGIIYVADYGLQAVVIFNPINDNYEWNKIEKPNHPLYGEKTKFLPSKIVVDSVGTMYVVDAGNNNGLVTITKEGIFSGYFGANEISLSFSSLVKFVFSTKEQKKSLFASPIAPVNLAIDQDGLINTISSSQTNPLKKLNIAGLNIFTNPMVDSSLFIDVCVGPTKTIYTVSSDGYIYEYDQEGNLLFCMGATDQTGKYMGVLTEPHSIEVDSNYNLYLLDKNSIQLYYQTDFANLIHEALTMYHEGLYSQSKVPWEQVLSMNNMFDLAHKGLGNAYLREGDYKNALYEFKLAKDVNGYSKAYWEVRNTWLNENGTWLIIGFILLIILVILIKKYHLIHKFCNWTKLSDLYRKSKFLQGLKFYFRFIRHPLNSFYEVKSRHKMSILSAIFYYVIFFLLILASNIWTGFVFNQNDIELISIIKIFITSIGPLLLFVVIEYLISSITEGNATMKDIFIGTICSFAPVICFLPFVIILSNFIVVSESFLYTVPKLILYGWSFILMYFMVKDLQDLQFGETNKNIILTVLTMVLFIAFAFLIYVLSAQLFSYFKDIIVEVIAHG